MNDIVDRASLEQQAWLDEQIKQAQTHDVINDDEMCVDCGNDIGAERKRAVPSATRCIVCQTKYEAK